MIVEALKQKEIKIGLLNIRQIIINRSEMLKLIQILLCPSK